ncbi:ABC transporter permease [Nocardioides bruguierae]|uniref:Iron chelate uptake ABC transporter family permease subunit n=1 Tax=Nocardioides bruguierae TaxID=2945102 RepID=A0A9X2D7K6_9ACTN|nr:iron chelate uptake ABC transporter family permease subunit [Nocardioides bruguierae]MCM0620733.1 iron chelate uptake ABC transporter family permease subunit [Nocardioides bruguierae]
MALAVLSTFVGVASVTPAALLRGDADAWQLLAVSRLPRTAALILAGVSLAVAGLVMQLLVRNRFVDPSTSGAVDASMLGLLAVMIFAPGMPVIGKMLVAALFALAGTGLFLLLLSRMPLRSPITVPLVGITFGGVLGAAGSFVAYEQDLIQSMLAWRTADFSGLLAGRYELLWVAAALAVVVWFLADRLTIAGLGKDAATGLGLSYRTVMITGMVVVSLISATVTATVGDVPFLGLIVPNVVSLLVGDHARRSVPWVALLGAGFLLLCDVIGRLVRYPYEVPLGVVVGVLGSAAFLYLLVKGSRRVG